MSRVPFPDVTGRRLRAPSRTSFAGNGMASLGHASMNATNITWKDLHEAAQDFGVSPRAIISAAWGYVLYLYVMHECDNVAFDAVDADTCVAISFGPSLCRWEDPISMVQLSEKAWLSDRHVQIHGPVLFVSAPDQDTQSALSLAESTLARTNSSLSLVFIAHQAHTSTSSSSSHPVALTLLASPSVHIHGSAMTQLAQVEHVLHALVHRLDPTKSIPTELMSLVNPDPIFMSRDMPGGIEYERLEDQFLRRAQETPHMPALTCCTSVSPPSFVTWTYEELNKRSDDIAKLVWSRGVGYAASTSSVPAHEDQVVVLCMSKCMDMYASILGILKAGAAWCPIDPGWPPSRQAALLIKSGARLALTTGDDDARILEDLCPQHIQMVRLDRPMDAASMLERTPERAHATHLAYKIWTSGTTGLPKAVGVEHVAAVQGMRALQVAVPTALDVPVRPGSLRYLQFAAYVFDLSIFDIFYTWGHGGTVCFAPLDMLLSRLVDVANALQVTHTLFTPAVSAMVPRHAVPTMRVMINGGEKLSQAVADNWSQDCRVVNIYGPAEATLSLTMREVVPDDEVKAHNIGTAFDDALCVLMDGKGRIVPRGCIGELMLGGPQLARGYIGDDEKTREKFVMHPTFGRLYHTGDLARQLWDGQFEYLGRNDDQVKINGVRIELLEINAAVKSVSKHVRDADTVALPGPDPNEPPRIVAFAVCPPPPDVDKVSSHDHSSSLARCESAPAFLRTDDDAVTMARTLRSGTQALLPSYMVPFHFVILSSFPRTSSAKIDRRAVRAAYEALDLAAWEARVGDEQGAGHDADAQHIMTHPLAVRLCSILPRIGCVRCEQISSSVRFTMLGINSVRAMALSAKLVEAGFHVSAADLARHDSLSKLIRAYSERAHVDPHECRHAWYAAWKHAYASTLNVPHAHVQPATSLQQGMLLESHLDSTRYWLFRVMHAQTTVDRLRAALERTARDMDCLRMGFLPLGSNQTSSGSSASPYAPLFAAVVHEEPHITLLSFAGDVLESLRPRVPDAANGQPPWFAAYDSDTQRFVLILHHALYDAPTLDFVLARIDQLCADPNAKAKRTTPWTQALCDLVPSPDQEQVSLDAWSKYLTTMEHTSWPVLQTRRTGPVHTLQIHKRVASISWQALEQTAAQLGTSVRPLAHLAWARVLSAYLGTSRILLGDVMSLRGRRAEYTSTGGPLLATLPVSVDLSKGTVAEQVQHMHMVYSHLQDHASVPLSFVRHLVNCPPDQPLFVSLFVLEMDSEPDVSERLLSWQHGTDLGLSVEHTLALELRISRDGTVSFVLNSICSSVSDEYARLILAQMDTLLAAYVHDTSLDVSHLPARLDAALLARQLMPAPTRPVYPNVAAWVQHYASSAACTNTAVEYRDSFSSTDISTLSFAELHLQSAKIASWLLRFAPRSVVGVAMPRSLSTYICLLGILRAGLVYLPLDESLPHVRRDQLLRDSGAVLVITAEDHDPTAPWPCDRARPSDMISEHGPDMRPIDANDPAYILYTSGSTGHPKGCVLSHANLAYAIDNFRHAFGSVSWYNARFLARSAEAFDVHLLECLLAWQMGATVVAMRRSLLLADLGVAMANANVTHACVVPSLFFTQGRRIVPSDLPSLRALIVGGEKIADDIVEHWGSSRGRANASRILVLNAYGPTEATIGISCTPVYVDSLASDIGTAFAGNAFVIRANDRVALRGEAGELCIVGTHVGLGYIHRDSDAFFEMDGMRAYKTGDLARMMPDGHIEYLGRVGHNQVKVRGARVELTEVDTALQMAGAKHAVTLLLTHPEFEEPHLVAFVSDHIDMCTDSQPPTVTTSDTSYLLHALRHTLVTYMVPSVILTISALPLARVSGKLDRRALENIYTTLKRVSLFDHTPPQTLAERTAARVIQDVLGVDEVGVHADLFSLGLDSLKTVRLAYALEQVGIRVPIAVIMTSPSLAGILAHSSDRNAAVVAREDETPQSMPPPLPLQCATLAQSLAEPSKHWYIHHVRLHLEPTNSIERRQIMRQWRNTLAQFKIYRTVFHVDSHMSMEVLDTLPAIDTCLDEPCTNAACDRVADDILARLDEWPPVRLVLYTDVLCLSMHHAIYDAASLDLLVAAVSGETSADTFFDVVRHAAQSVDANAQYYARLLQDMIRTPMPNLTGKYEEAGASHLLIWKPRLTLIELQSCAQVLHITVQSLILHAFASLMAEYVGEEEATLGIVLSGRMGDAKHATAHGPCITTVPFRWKATHDAQGVHQQLTEALHHQFVHLTDVAHAIGMDTTLFDVLFSFLPASGATATSLPHGVRAWESYMATDFVYALQVMTDERGNSIVFESTYAPDRVPAEQVGLILRQLEDRLRTIVNGVGIGKDRTLDNGCHASDRACLLACVHPEPYEPTDADAFLARFAKHVKTQPDAEALTFASSVQPLVAKTLTYHQVDVLSSQYAQHLVQQQVPSGDAVYVHLPRSLSLYLVLLAAWKAQKVYVPLDPTLPLDRLRYMIQIVGSGTIVTTDEYEHMIDVSLPRLLLRQLEEPCSERPFTYEPSLRVPAYILFTSGSTGKPKGVQISHRALAAAIKSWKIMLPYTQQSRLLQLASPGFDVSLFELCLPLSLGFAMATAPKDILLTDLEAAFRALRITMADLPAALAALVHPEHLPPMEWLMSGGDMVDERVVREWGTPPQKLINAYGPTEGTIGNTLGHVDANTRRSVVGKVYPATTLYICRGNELAYTGAVGEIVVGGPQVADGYVGAPELTAQKFPTLTLGTRSQRVYRTGDRGRLLHNGVVECLGRMERGQVKVNGQRVELDEIAHELATEFGISDACVQYLQHPSHPSKQLVAFLALTSVSQSTSAALDVRTDPDALSRAQQCLRGAQKRLAPYMVPAHTLVLTTPLPLTPNNKVDVKRLANLYMDMDPKRMRDAKSSRPLTQTELNLLRILAEFTHMAPADIDRDASFYTLGIDSLSAIRLVKLMRLRGMKLTVSELLAHATPSRVAAVLDEMPAKNEEDFAVYKDILQEAALPSNLSSRHVLPCTPLQAGMLAQTAASFGGLYTHIHAFSLDVSAEAIVSAWARIVRNNAILRTTFEPYDCQQVPWVQVVHDDWPLSAPALVQHAPSTPLDVVLRAAQAACDPSTRPHVLHMVPTSDNSVMAVWAMHHALYDAHTLDVLFDDVDAVLCGEQAPERLPFESVVPHLCAGSPHVPYWLGTLRGYVPRTLSPYRRNMAAAIPGSAAMLSSSASISREARTSTFDTQLASSIAEDVCRQCGVSMHTLATLVFAFLLAECMQTTDVCFGQVLSLRSDVHDAVDVLGPMLNTIPTRVKLQASSFDAQLESLQQTVDAARPHRHAPLRSIAVEHQRTHNSTAPLVEALLDVQQHAANDQHPIHIRRIPLDMEDQVQYALNVEFIQTPTTIRLVATARTSFCGHSSNLQALLRRMSDILQTIVSNPRGTLAVAPLDLEQPTIQPSNTLSPSPASAATELEDIPPDILLQVRELTADVACVPLSDVLADTPLLLLGLDSIVAIQIIARARVRNMSLQMGDLAAGTPRGIAAAWCERMKHESETSSVGMAPLSSPIPLSFASNAPCTQAQVATATAAAAAAEAHCPMQDVVAVRPLSAGQMMHMASLVHSHHREGVFFHAYRARGQLDSKRLAHAWEELQKRHEVLRSIFVCVHDREPAQVVLKRTQNMHMHHVSRSDDAMPCVFAHHRTWPADEPWASADLVRIDGEDSKNDVVVLSLFHAMYDAWSLPVLVDDLVSLYQGDGTPASQATELAPASMANLLTAASQSKDVSAIQHHWASYASAPPCIAAQQSDIDGAIEKPSVAKAMTSTVAAPTTASFTFVHQRDIVHCVQRLRMHLASHQISLPSVLVAAWASVLHDVVHTSVPVLGLYQAARSLATLDLSRSAIPCVNMLPIAVPWHPSLLSMAQYVASALVERVPLEQVSLEDVHRALEKVAPGPTTFPHFDTMLNVLIQPSASAGAGGDVGSEILLEPMQSPICEEHLRSPPRICERTSFDAWPGAGHYPTAGIAVDAYVDDQDNLSLALRCPAHVLSEQKAKALLVKFAAYVQTVQPCVPR